METQHSEPSLGMQLSSQCVWSVAQPRGSLASNGENHTYAAFEWSFIVNYKRKAIACAIINNQLFQLIQTHAHRLQPNT